MCYALAAVFPHLGKCGLLFLNHHVATATHTHENRHTIVRYLHMECIPTHGIRNAYSNKHSNRGMKRWACGGEAYVAEAVTRRSKPMSQKMQSVVHLPSYRVVHQTSYSVVHLGGV